MLSVSQLISHIRSLLNDHYPETETESFIRILFRHYAGMSPMELYLHADDDVPAVNELRIRAAVDDLGKYRPIQYITGETEFCGLKFRLTPDVLIPRPETEELTDRIICDYQSETALGFPKILDIGTGSGCIAVSLAAALPHAEVWATDISAPALAVAEKNAIINDVKLHAVLGDILSDDADNLFPEKYFDAIASNPPYVSQSDKAQMQPNVLNYEPHAALFPQSDDPLIFYKRIAAFGWKHLTDGGHLYFEINETYPDETAAILQNSGYENVTLQKDMSGKWRMIVAEKK